MTQTIAIIGGGPAGLMAAEALAQQGLQVQIYDAMPSMGRKFLLAGKGGLNLTHSEPLSSFLARYGAQQEYVAPWLAMLGPEQIRAWAQSLGVTTFVGSSGRVFPSEMKAAPLLRAWLHRLRQLGVQFFVQHRWQGWNEQGYLCLQSPDQSEIVLTPDATLLALGGASWPQLGSDGRWVDLLAKHNICITPLKPANCGFDIAWSPYFAEHHAGDALKTISLISADHHHRGECVITANGIEGSLIYAHAAQLREQIATQGHAILSLDLLPDRTLAQVQSDLNRPRGADSLANHLRRKVGISGVKAGLLREVLSKEQMQDMACIAAHLKALPLRLDAPRPLAEAISTAGGIAFSELDTHLMLKQIPGLFCAGEMLDWEAPTGGYLLTACMASGYFAAQGIRQWLA